MPFHRRRRRGFGFGTQPKVKAPKVKVHMKIKRPKVSDLKRILAKYVSASEADRLNALASAAMWYEDGAANGAVAYVLANRLFPTTEPDFKKSIDRAGLARQRAAGTNFPAERDTSLRMAVKAYEKCCEKLGVPKLQDVLDEYEKKKQQLDAKAQKFQDRFGDGLVSIQQAMGLPLKIVFCEHCNEYKAERDGVVCGLAHSDKIQIINATIEKLSATDSKVARSINMHDKALVYNRETAKELTQAMRREGILIALMRELPAIVRYSSVQKSADGQSWVSNRDAHLAFHAQAMLNIERWLKSDKAPNRLVRKGAVQAQPTQAGQQPSAPRAPRTSMAASEKTKKVLDLLSKGDWFTAAQIRKQLNLTTVNNLLRSLGAQLEWGQAGHGNKVRLVKPAGGAP